MISSVSFCSSKTGGLDTVCRIVENLDNRVDTVGRGSVEVIGRVINMISLNKKICLADRKNRISKKPSLCCCVLTFYLAPVFNFESPLFDQKASF